MLHCNVIRISVVCLALLSSALTGCSTTIATSSNPNQGGITVHLGNGAVIWPFNPTQIGWSIENGYNTGPDHFHYEQYSFDFQRAGGTTGQTVLSPVNGTSVAFGPAYPGDGSSGQCVSISISGHSGYHMMVCHLVHPTVGSVTFGSRLGTVSGGSHGDHIHITLYCLDPSKADTIANSSLRKGIPFSDPWTIAGCDYPSNGSANQWQGSSVPCIP